MKILIHFCLILILLTAAVFAKGQVKIDEHDLITRLTSLSILDVTTASQYFTDRRFKLIDKRDLKQPTYTETLYKYQIAGNDDSYTLMEMTGKVIGAGYITYSKANRDAALTAALKAGYSAKQQINPGQSVEMYYKGNFRLVILTQTAQNKTFYILGIGDQVRTDKLLKGLPVN